MPKREDYIDWKTYFMKVAEITAMRSKDPHKQVGAVIVNKYNRIVATGYNGMPGGHDEFPWDKGEDLPYEESKHAYCVHAEANAICNWYNRTINAGYELYTTLYPCNHCAKLIVQSGIKKVHYLETKDKIEYKISEQILNACGIETEQLFF